MNPQPLYDVSLPDESATLEFGRRLADLLIPNDVLALVGPLGAGKTILVKGIAAGLGLDDPTTVTSPTFVLVNEYPARIYIYHVDAYRLADPAQLWALGFDEMLSASALVLIEWADRVAPALPPSAVWLDLAIVLTGRRLTIRPTSPRAAHLGHAL